MLMEMSSQFQKTEGIIKQIMLKKTVSFPFDKLQRVQMIQRTYNNTWTMLIRKFDKITLHSKFYIKHTQTDGTEIQVYQLKKWSIGFELVSESKILITFLFHLQNSFMVIDLLEGSSKSFPFPMPDHGSLKIFRFCQSGLICLHKAFRASQFLLPYQSGQSQYSETFSYYSQSSLEEGKPLLEYTNIYGLHYSKHIRDFAILGGKANEHSLITSYSFRLGYNNQALLLHDVVLSHGKAQSRVRYLEPIGWWGSLWQLTQNSFIQYSFQKPLGDSFKVESKVLKSEDKSKQKLIIVKGFPFQSELEEQAVSNHYYNPSVFSIDGRIYWKLTEQQSLKVFDPHYSSWDSISYQQIQEPSYQKDRISKAYDKKAWHPDRSFQKSSLSPSTLFEHYLNEEESTITVITLDFFGMKDKLMHLLLGLNEDFDDDLLLDVLDVIDCL